MVFEPTFEEIGDRADDLPDLTGAEPAADRSEGDGGLADAGPASGDDAQDDVVEGEADATIRSGGVSAADLPPLGN